MGESVEKVCRYNVYILLGLCLNEASGSNIFNDIL